MAVQNVDKESAMSENKHQVGYIPDLLQVTVNGLVDGVPFGVKIDAKEKTALFIENSKIKPPSSHKITTETSKGDKNCPGCKSTLTKLIKGGVGWAKELLGVDQVHPELAKSRKFICENCLSNCYDFGVCRDDWTDREKQDQGCGCILSLKILQASESCPHNHWDAIK